MIHLALWRLSFYLASKYYSECVVTRQTGTHHSQMSSSHSGSPGLLDLKNLAHVKIDRCYLPADFQEVQRYELHNFSDASVAGYGVCTYLRAISKSGQIHCSLVIAQSRVAPTKITTGPRLELSAAVVASAHK